MAASSAYQHTRWNFTIIVLDASFFIAALAFVDPVAILPILVSDLGGSRTLVGLVSALQRAGWLIPQLLGASLVLHRTRKKPFLIYPCLLSRLPFLSLAIVFTLPWAASHHRALLILLVAVYSIFFFGDGLSGVPWYDIIGRSIPPALRGRFFGGMQFLGGLLAVGAGAVVRRVLADDSLRFPHGYGYLFIFLFAGMVLSTLCLALIKEPPGAAAQQAQSLGRVIRSIPSVLRRYPLLRRLIPGQILCGLAGLAVPFYAIYAHSRLGLPAAVGGIFIWGATMGSVGASLVWAYLSDRFGSTAVIRGVACLVIATPLAALLIPLLLARLGAGQQTAAYSYAVVFLLNGATWGGMWIGFTNYVLEIAPDDLRPLFVGMQATLSSPTVVMPLLGGLMLRAIPFEALFALVSAAGLASVIYVYRLPEPRHTPGVA
jgi:MFS family permease